MCCCQAGFWSVCLSLELSKQKGGSLLSSSLLVVVVIPCRNLSRVADSPITGVSVYLQANEQVRSSIDTPEGSRCALVCAPGYLVLVGVQGCCRCPGVSRVVEDLAPKRLIEECFDCHCLFPALRGAHCVYRMCVSEREALSRGDCTRYTHI